jgi:multidrug efflux pump subunit AcrB
MIGVLLLMGIVKKNSILLVEYADQVKEHEGLGALEAMKKAGPLRLRPILMTTISARIKAKLWKPRAEPAPAPEPHG